MADAALGRRLGVRGAPAVSGRASRAVADAALVAAAQRGSHDAVAELFRRHWPRVHRAAYLVVHDAAAAEDIAQEAFVAAIRALDRFDRARPFAPWLHRIAVNRSIDFARAREGRREAAGLPVPDRGTPAAGAADRPSDEILAALAALAPEQRAVVVLRHLLGFTPGEVARALDLPRGTVNSRLRRGLDALADGVARESGPVGVAPSSEEVRS